MAEARAAAPGEKKTVSAAERRWLRDTKARTEAKREQTAAEAAAGAASLLASAITLISEVGAEADIALRAGGIIRVVAPGMGVIATIKAGDGWAAAIISPRVLNGAPGTGGTGDRGDGITEPYSGASVSAPYAPGAVLTTPRLPTVQFAQAMRRAIRYAHPQWVPGQVEAEVQRSWEDMVSQP